MLLLLTESQEAKKRRQTQRGDPPVPMISRQSKRAGNQAGQIERDDPPACLLGLTWLLCFGLHLLGQQRQQVDGNVILTVLLFQAVHHASREGKGAEMEKFGDLQTGYRSAIVLLMLHTTHSVISGPKSTTKSSWKSCKTLWEIVSCLEHIDYRTRITNNLLII